MTRDSHEIMALRVVYWKQRTVLAIMECTILKAKPLPNRITSRTSEKLLQTHRDNANKFLNAYGACCAIEIFAKDCGVTL